MQFKRGHDGGEHVWWLSSLSPFGWIHAGIPQHKGSETSNPPFPYTRGPGALYRAQE